MITWQVPIWKKAPFLRLLPPLIAGIITQWHLPFPLTVIIISTVTSLAITLGYSLFKLAFRFRIISIIGLSAQFLFVSMGALLVYKQHIHNESNWFGRHSNIETFECILDEPPIEKQKSWKAVARITTIAKSDSSLRARGKLIIYFEKETFDPRLTYGSRIAFKKEIQPIHNSSNPGGFNYQRYALFQGITHQVFLRKKNYETISHGNGNSIWHFIYRLRNNVLRILRSAFTGEKELGLAEALLIGYKDDLDKSLVQSYSNTGVVHVIAISGLHLGLIYGLLIFICRPITKKKALRWAHPVIIISCLWIFTLLAGAQPSVLRSAVMFTCIVIGKSINRQNHIYNSLAFSAFILLCINPFWLWDLGFLLSYSAVLSIVLFMRPIYNLVYIKNKILDLAWQLNAVTLSAQLLTIPISIYHFHQFPNYFLPANFIAVPLSSLILFGEILLIVFAPIKFLILKAGNILSFLIQFMNTFVETIDSLPYSRLQHLQIDSVQLFLMYVLILCFCYGLILKSIRLINYGLFALLAFVCIRSISIINSYQQAKIIVYNASNNQAIDIIIGNRFYFIGDSTANTALHIVPTRTYFRATDQHAADHRFNHNFLNIENKRILVLDSSLKNIRLKSKTTVDLLVISAARPRDRKDLNDKLIATRLVIDARTPPWITREWEKIADSLNIPCHNVAKSGAFVMNLH